MRDASTNVSSAQRDVSSLKLICPAIMAVENLNLVEILSGCEQNSKIPLAKWILVLLCSILHSRILSVFSICLKFFNHLCKFLLRLIA